MKYIGTHINIISFSYSNVFIILSFLTTAVEWYTCSVFTCTYVRSNTLTCEQNLSQISDAVVQLNHQ